MVGVRVRVGVGFRVGVGVRVGIGVRARVRPAPSESGLMSRWMVRPSGPAGAGSGVQSLSRPLSREVLPISASPRSTSMQVRAMAVPASRSLK